MSHKKINPHLFRHSSATFYASKLNRQELCYRYGWAFSSDMPDVYISRAGMNNKDLDEKMENTELGELKTQLNKEQFERKKQQDEIEAIKKDLLLRRKLDPLLNEIFKHPEFEKVALDALKKTGVRV